MDEFFNPKSMITPGIAGAGLMLIANAVCYLFPEMPFRWVALGTSLLIGYFTVSALNAAARIKTAYWLANSLIIFSMGVGASNIGANLVQGTPRPVQATLTSAAKAAGLSSILIGTAHAQDQGSGGNGARREGFFKRW